MAKKSKVLKIKSMSKGITAKQAVSRALYGKKRAKLV